MMKDLIYTIPKEKHTKENIKAILKVIQKLNLFHL